ncbi:MAG: hypothetical protein WDO15_29315 [Bacteroidota bacterium]
MTRLFLFAIAISCLLSCRPQAGDENYVSWVRDYQNGMHVRQVQNDLAFDLQFQPSEYVWLQRNGNFDADAFESKRADLDQMQYFTLNIYSSDGKTDIVKQRAEGDEDREKELLYYFSYRFQNDISVDDGSRQLPCTLFHYEQHGTKSFVLGFEKGEASLEDVTFIINSPLVDINPVKIKVSTDPKVL